MVKGDLELGIETRLKDNLGPCVVDVQGANEENIRKEPYALHKQVNRSAFGQIRFQSPVAHETHLGQNEPEAVRPEQSRPESTARLGLDHEPPQGILQPRL